MVYLLVCLVRYLLSTKTCTKMKINTKSNPKRVILSIYLLSVANLFAVKRFQCGFKVFKVVIST